jgi:hypothetical protein
MAEPCGARLQPTVGHDGSSPIQNFELQQLQRFKETIATLLKLQTSLLYFAL